MRAFLNRRLGLQSSIDFITSYGVVLLVASVTIYLILQLGVFNPQLAPSYCNPAVSFSCTGYVLYTNGTFTFELTQTIGGAINITGMGCSTEINGTGIGPRYGNVNLVGAPQYYPTNGFARNTILLSNTARQFSVYCYNKPGSTPATGTLGTAFIGYVWMNYTYSGLPASYPTAQQVLAFSTTYT
jgi:hypothetical protein